MENIFEAKQEKRVAFRLFQAPGHAYFSLSKWEQWRPPGAISPEGFMIFADYSVTWQLFYLWLVAERLILLEPQLRHV